MHILVWLEDRDRALVKLDKWEEFAFPEGPATIESQAQRLSIFVELDHAHIELDLNSNHISFLELVVFGHILVVDSWYLAAIRLSVKQIKDIVLFLLIFNHSIFVQIEVVPTETKTHLDTRLHLWNNRPWHWWVKLLVVICFYLELVVVDILLVLIEDEWLQSDSLAAWISILMVRPNKRQIRDMMNSSNTPFLAFLAPFKDESLCALWDELVEFVLGHILF